MTEQNTDGSARRRKPATKATARSTKDEPADPLCPACDKPIRPADGVAKYGHDILHVACFIRHAST